MRGIIVTKLKPCIVNEKLLTKIEALKKTNLRYRSQVIFVFRIPDQSEFKIEVLDGEVPEIESLEEFEKDCFEERAQQPTRRNILVGRTPPDSATATEAQPPPTP
jgi:hypothetical protein